jgi:hypothetical protein
LGDQPWQPLCRASGGRTDHCRQSSHQTREQGVERPKEKKKGKKEEDTAS